MKGRSLNPSSGLIREQEIVDAWNEEYRNARLDNRIVKTHSQICFEKFGCCIEAHIKTPVDPYKYWLKFSKFINNKKVEV